MQEENAITVRGFNGQHVVCVKGGTKKAKSYTCEVFYDELMTQPFGLGTFKDVKIAPKLRTFKDKSIIMPPVGSDVILNCEIKGEDPDRILNCHSPQELEENIKPNLTKESYKVPELEEIGDEFEEARKEIQLLEKFFETDG